jgi:hypothetical protein
MALASLTEADGTVSARLRLAMLTGWAPAENQPKPLKPGTGQMSLGKALGNEN